MILAYDVGLNAYYSDLSIRSSIIVLLFLLNQSASPAGGLEHVLFVHILGIIIPTDFHIFQRGRSTTNQFLISS